MKKILSFEERAKLAMEALAKQPPVTIEEVRAQVKWLKEKSTSKNKKVRPSDNSEPSDSETKS